MPGKHAKLLPSAAERWLECPASIRMESQVPSQGSSVYTEEGTCAHELAELKASLRFELINRKTYESRLKKWVNRWPQYATHDETVAEMERHTDAYVELLSGFVEATPHSNVLLEQRLDTGVPTCWGTTDAIVVSPTVVHVVDFKYGQGVTVEAHGNPQLRLYALGALDTYGDVLGETEVVRITVHQPRLDHTLTEEITPEALREWREKKVLPIAEVALTDDAPFGPSETACWWCPASGRCQAQLEQVFAEPFTVPEVLTPEDAAATLARVPEVRKWLKAFEEAALTMAYSEGTQIPGYKVVLSGGKRAVRDHEAALKVLLEAGYDIGEVSTTKARALGELEKLLGKEKFHELLEESHIVTKSDGQPALVLESDKRPSITPNNEAAKVFEAEDLL